ncbi:hypothetical protein SCP_0111340 [Sparassis crispa]|uniref:RAVE complex protein Rav1 C-terminal domain-containing protein n=1 Tax=Sparassis crispa TaxID=139825 RepID=A0A401G7V6_9APHY|nr:hypothetical protein SCP_0111340 [Sparassis crispa]GBE78251.1 hypothetical protein SCP_0111340 [Sparassis crispa]
MLELLQSYTGSPTTTLYSLALPREILLLYPSGDSVVILNARTLVFVRALAFWEAFPGTRHRKDPIQCLTIDPGMKLAVASMGSRVAAWSHSGVHSDAWRLHSTLLLPEDDPVTAIDCKSGLLAVGTRSSLSVYTLILENDLLTWSQKWKCFIATPACVRFSPSLMYIAASFLHNNIVRIYSTASGRQTQAIPHPRPLTDIVWRRPQATSRDDPILYTTTSDGTLRIFLPVLDVPQYMQLHAALDAASAFPFPTAPTTSSIFPLDRDAVSSALTEVLAGAQSESEDARSRRVREIAEEGWDLFLRVLADGSLVVQAVANINRRPPTLLKQFTLLRSPPGLLLGNRPPTQLFIIPAPSGGSTPTLTLVTAAPLASYTLSPLPFFDARADGLRLLARAVEEETGAQTLREIVRFVRTPEGEGVGVLWEDGSGRTWAVGTGGKEKGMSLVRRGIWKADAFGSADQLVVLDSGRSFVTYASSTNLLTLHTLDDAPATLTVPPLLSLFSLFSPGSNFALIGITPSHEVLLFTLVPLSLYSRRVLPLGINTSLKVILPVDPMAWSGPYARAASTEEHDVLLSVSVDGELAFWVPGEEVTGMVSVAAVNGVRNGKDKGNGWRCTGRVKTGRRGLSMAGCSSAKKSVLIVPGKDGQELTIWDSKESEFASGLEYREIFDSSDPIQDLDWTATPDAQSILAVGFAHRVEVLCQQRMTYFDETPAWGRCWTIDVGSMIPHPINDSIWLARGALLVGAGHFMALFGQPQPVLESSASEESLFEHVARYNGPLEDYHPQMVLQCLLWEKVELVKKIIVNLARNLESGKDVEEWRCVPFEEFFQKDEMARAESVHKQQYSLLFSVPETREVSDDDQFSRSLVKQLIERLEEQPLPHLTSNEHASLLVLIQATLEIQEQRRALDANGLRYLISTRSFVIQNRRLSLPNTPASNGNGALAGRIRPRARLRYRDMIWAFHSESQDLLLSTSVAACGGKMTWTDARALGVFIWMHSGEPMRAHMEVIARNQYMAGDNRDPTECSLFYFALGKGKLVHALWRQAAWHREQNVMLKFLNNDFTQPRWQTAALKNAFALLSKRRFEYAAAFFLLGGSLKDAVNVCIKNLSDFQLAVALARVVEQDDDGPIFQDILINTVVPLAFKEGNRWLASWAFWLLHRRDLAVRILVTPLQDIASVLDVRLTEIGDPHYDDPSLALLFSQLKFKTLQTAKGTSEISGRTEFNFVLQIARVFCRMGCHVLALDLVRTWSFHRPSTVVHDGRPLRRPPSPISTRFALEPALRRKSSIFIDMDVTTAPPTRRASPTPQVTNGLPAVGLPSTVSGEEMKEESDFIARKAGLGSLMKSAKQDVQVPEFSMDAFF